MKTIEVRSQAEFDLAVEELPDEIDILEGTIVVSGVTNIIINALGFAVVVVHDSTSVVAKNSSMVYSFGASFVYANDSSRVIAHDSSKVDAYNSSRVDCYDSSEVTYFR